MKLLVIGPMQSALSESPEGLERRALQERQVEGYAVLTPKPGEGKFAAALRMRRESAQIDFDTVSAQDPFFVGHLAWHIARMRGARLNIQVHADLNAQPLWKRAWATFHLRRADSIRVVSQKIKEQALKLGVRAPIAVLPVYIDVSRFKNILRRPERIVLWVGRFEKEKDPIRALDVIKNIPDAKLVMLGQGSMEKKLKEEAKNLPVEFPGWQDPLPYFERAGVVLSTSPAESFGASIVEALAAGVPVVSLDVGAAKEAGATVVPRSDLAQAVTSALSSNMRGELKLKLLNKEEWAAAWRRSL